MSLPCFLPIGVACLRISWKTVAYAFCGKNDNIVKQSDVLLICCLFFSAV